MSVCFCGIMADLLKEANEGAFATKGQAVDRRDELVAVMNGQSKEDEATQLYLAETADLLRDEPSTLLERDSLEEDEGSDEASDDC